MNKACRSWLFIACLLLVLTSILTPVHALAADTLCFAKTTPCVTGRFLNYWQHNGGLAVFGLPITAAQNERKQDTGAIYLTQRFERTRFESQSDLLVPTDMLLARLGIDHLVLPALAVAGPTLTLEPGNGSCGTRVMARGTGMPAGMPILLQAGGDNGPEIGHGWAAANGTFAVSVIPCTTATSEPFGYRLPVVAGPDKAAIMASPDPAHFLFGDLRLPMFAYATFTITAAPMSLPSTGGANSPVPIWIILISGLGLVAIGIGVRQHRCSYKFKALAQQLASQEVMHVAQSLAPVN